MRAAIYLLAGLKRVKNEGQQREFFPTRRAKIVENVVGCLVF